VTLKTGVGCSKVAVDSGTVRQTIYDFLLFRRYNYSSISCTILSYLTLNNIVTLKSGLKVTQGHSNW